MQTKRAISFSDGFFHHPNLLCNFLIANWSRKIHRKFNTIENGWQKCEQAVKWNLNKKNQKKAASIATFTQIKNNKSQNFCFDLVLTN